MPSFVTEVEVAFEAFCNRCGAGICHNVKTRYSHTREFPQITVEPCEVCVDAADANSESKHEIEKLEDKIEALMGDLEDFQRYTGCENAREIEEREWEDYIDSFYKEKH